MQTVVADYSNTIFYKISCKDAAITDLYIGHTINFVQRKATHKQGCNNPKTATYNLKLYNVIRRNGGWTNWRMDIIAHHDCKDLRDARTKEQEYFILYNATLNSIEPMPTSTYRKALMTTVNQNDIETTRTCGPHRNSSKAFICEKCNFKCKKKSNFDTHLLTVKHNSVNNVVRHFPANAIGYHACICGNLYKHRQSLFTHKKVCKELNCNDTYDSDIIQTDNSYPPQPLRQIVDSSLINELIKQNQDFKQLMMEQSKQFAEQQTQILQAIRVGIGNNAK
jgi:hypothetical protein